MGGLLKGMFRDAEIGLPSLKLQPLWECKIRMTTLGPVHKIATLVTKGKVPSRKWCDLCSQQPRWATTGQARDTVQP